MGGGGGGVGGGGGWCGGSVRVGNEIGAGHPKSAAFSVVVVTLSSVVVSVVAAAVVLIFRDVISYAFTDGEIYIYIYIYINGGCVVWAV